MPTLDGWSTTGTNYVRFSVPDGATIDYTGYSTVEVPETITNPDGLVEYIARAFGAPPAPMTEEERQRRENELSLIASAVVAPGGCDPSLSHAQGEINRMADEMRRYFSGEGETW